MHNWDGNAGFKKRVISGWSGSGPDWFKYVRALSKHQYSKLKVQSGHTSVNLLLNNR
jgi:hypothetical protein